MMVGGEVRVVKVLGLPTRRTSAAQAKTYYSELDRNLDH
jgi:ribosomal 50S subunit-recycling heat shock protein